MGSEGADVVPCQPQAVVVRSGGGDRVRLGRHVADPRVEQTAVNQREEIVVEATHRVV